MDTSQIRIQLLGQHADLRALIEQTRVTATRPRQGWPPDAGDDLAARVVRLARALKAHNACEEELLKGLLATVDAWGPARAEIMHERHHAEHEDLHSELLDASFDPGRVGHLLDRLLEHMAYEEQAFLNEDVLREDSIVINAFGG